MCKKNRLNRPKTKGLCKTAHLCADLSITKLNPDPRREAGDEDALGARCAEVMELGALDR